MELSKARVRLLRRIMTRKGREAEGVVLLEGPRTIEAAHQDGAQVLFVLHCSQSADPVALLEILTRNGVEVIEITEGELAEFSQTEAPQGVLALAREPVRELPDPSGAGGEKVLLLDRIQDPGNVGTLVRAAAALGVERILLLDGTADAWGAKAVRASTGSVFSLPLHRVRWDEADAWLQGAGLPLLVAHGPGKDVRRWLAEDAKEGGEGGVVPSSGWALLIGNEGEGPRPEAFASAASLLSIPLESGVESLNAALAGAILLWALGPGRARIE